MPAPTAAASDSSPSTPVGGDVRARLSAHFAAVAPSGVVAAWLFGSHVEGRAHRESDVDVGVLLDRRAHPTATDRFEAALALHADLSTALALPRLDLVVLNDVPPGLAAHVVTAGVRVGCGDAEGEHAFRRDAQRRAADLRPWLARMRRLKLEAIAR